VKLDLSVAVFIENKIKLTEILRLLRNTKKTRTEQPVNSADDRQLDRTKHGA